MSAHSTRPRAGRECPPARAGALRGFTLIELLVVIAMMAIMAAMVMPAVIATNARSHSITCESRLQEVGLAARMYAEDYGVYPASLPQLTAGRYVGDPETLLCVKSAKEFYYQAPSPGTAPASPVAACTKPEGAWPHEDGRALVVLLANGKTKVQRR